MAAKRSRQSGGGGHGRAERPAPTETAYFRVVGKRRQTNFQRDSNDHWLDESFEIKLRNHKEEAVQVRVVEHMYRWIRWEVTASSAEPLKTDARTIEFRPTIPPGGEVTITYKVHYTW